MFEYLRSQRDHTCHVAQIRRDDKRIGDLREISELLDVVLSYAKLHRLATSSGTDRRSDFPKSLSGCSRDSENCLSLTFGFVDLLLFGGFGFLNNPLFLAFRLIDIRVAYAFGR